MRKTNISVYRTGIILVALTVKVPAKSQVFGEKFNVLAKNAATGLASGRPQRAGTFIPDKKNLLVRKILFFTNV